MSVFFFSLVVFSFNFLSLLWSTAEECKGRSIWRVTHCLTHLGYNSWDAPPLNPLPYLQKTLTKFQLKRTRLKKYWHHKKVVMIKKKQNKKLCCCQIELFQMQIFFFSVNVFFFNDIILDCPCFLFVNAVSSSIIQHFCFVSRMWYQQLSTTAAVRTCLAMALTASSMSCWYCCPTPPSSRSSSQPMETARRWRSSQAMEEERKTRTRRTPGRRPPQQLVRQLSWTARCAPLVDKFWPQKTSSPTRPCTLETVRNSRPCSQSAASSASLRFFRSPSLCSSIPCSSKARKTAACSLLDHCSSRGWTLCLTTDFITKGLA